MHMYVRTITQPVYNMPHGVHVDNFKGALHYGMDRGSLHYILIDKGIHIMKWTNVYTTLYIWNGQFCETHTYCSFFFTFFMLCINLLPLSSTVHGTVLLLYLHVTGNEGLLSVIAAAGIHNNIQDVLIQRSFSTGTKLTQDKCRQTTYGEGRSKSSTTIDKKSPPILTVAGT